MDIKIEKEHVVVMIATGIAIALLLSSAYGVFSGSHTLYDNRTTAPGFCNKCHPDKVTNISYALNAHRNIGCACHGYNPNATDLYNVNAAHNLTKNIYCTDCHTNYSITTGNITIHNGGLVANNQSAHYLINGSNRDEMYRRAKYFFNGSRR